MADDFKISYSFSLTGGEPSAKTAADAGAPPSPPLYAVRPTEELYLPDGNVLLLSRNSGHRLSVTRDVSIALNYCRQFRTLDEHAQFLVSSMPELAGNPRDVRNVLSVVKDAGLMIGTGEICEQINRSAQESVNRAPCRVFVITCDRSAAVERLLDSMLERAKLSDFEQLFLVDDSRSPEAARANEAAVAAFNRRSSEEIIYFGAESRRRFMDDLIRAAPTHESSIRFLTDRDRWPGLQTFGIARNLCLLLSVGARAVVLDDDVLCAAYDVPHRKSGVSFSAAVSEVDFFESAAEWQQVCSVADEDPLSEHMRFLGLTLPCALRELGHEKCTADLLVNAQASHAQALRGDSRIVVTQSGTLGYPGTLDNSWIVSAGKESIDRLLSHRRGMQGALEVRQWWRGRDRTTFLRRPEISQVTGLDNSMPLPPYIPVLRGEDLIFGTLLEFLFPTALAMESARAVPHLDLEDRRGRADGRSVMIRGGIALLSQYIEERQPEDPSVGFDVRLDALTQLFRELSQRSAGSLRALYRVELAKAQANQARLLTARLREADARPREWGAMLQEALAGTYSDLQEDRPLTQRGDGTENRDEEEILHRLLSASGAFADCLSAWTDLRQAAATVTGRLFG